MAAVTRFTSRRGCPSQIFSDHGTNFTGLNRVIKESWKKIEKEASIKLVSQNIDGQFIPPYAPSFGGIWEAAMKSLKYFTKRYGNVSAMVYEDFVTLLCRVEGLLNSRPIYPDPTDPSSASALTPFKMVTMRDFLNNPFDLEKFHKGAVTKHWLQILQLQKQIWNNFRQQYLQTLQKRHKWKNPARNVAVNDLVLLKDASSCPADWRMGKIIQTFPDEKGNVRRVLLRTAGKESMERAVKTLVPLLEEEEEGIIPQSRTRSSNRKTTLLTKIILTWLTLSTPMKIKANIIEPMQPGCKLITLGTAYVQTSEFLFQMKTSINITKNEEIINEFHQFCKNLNTSKFQEQCENLLRPLEITAIDVKKGINQESNTREKRRAALIAIGRFALKYGPSWLWQAEQYIKHSNYTEFNKSYQRSETGCTKCPLYC